MEKDRNDRTPLHLQDKKQTVQQVYNHDWNLIKTSESFII